MAETTQIESQSVQPENYNLSLSDLPYDEKYRLNQASASQLVRGLQEMTGRLPEPQNDYQKELYPVLKKIVEKVVDKYTSMIQSTSEVEREIRRFNLHGYNGRVKRAIVTRGVKFNLVYKYSNFGDYLKTITQRLTYLVERPLPQRYVTNTTEGTAYEQLKIQIQEFLKFIKDEVEQSWNTVVTQARTAGGNSVQENLRKRTERTTHRSPPSSDIRREDGFQQVNQQRPQHFQSRGQGPRFSQPRTQGYHGHATNTGQTSQTGYHGHATNTGQTSQTGFQQSQGQTRGGFGGRGGRGRGTWATRGAN
jgi:hypothetical protein